MYGRHCLHAGTAVVCEPALSLLHTTAAIYLYVKDKLDSITAKRHRLQKIFDNFKLKKLDDELNANSEHLEVDQDLDESVSSPVEENDKKMMKYVIEEVPPEKKFKHMITVNIPSGGRLGNLMFSYASMYGIAMENFMIPSLDYDSVLFEYFNITAKSIGANENKGSWAVYTEGAPNIYIEHETDRLNYEIDIQLYGFFQSWKYFRNVEQEIGKQFTFSISIQNTANSFLHDALEKFHISNKLKSGSSRFFFVGIHVRRGDMLDWDNFDRGYTVAPFSYLDFAMAYYEAKYQNLIFVVCSDDMKWSRKYLENRNTTVIFSEGHEAVEDLAILSYCNHSVITVGTFGWWAAWLAGGTTIYYKGFPQKFSYLSEVFSSKDYYPPHWIGLQ